VEVFPSEEALPHEVEAAASGLISFLKEQQWEIPFAVAVAETRDIRPSIDVAGRIDAPPDRIARVSAPVSGIVAVDGAATVGDRVSAGQSLAVLEPTAGESSYSSLRAEVDRLTREVERSERLFAAGAIPERRLIEARHELEVARARLTGVGGASDTGAGQAPGGADSYRFRLRSPIAGVVVERQLFPGQRVEAGDPAFTVLDGGALWLNLHVPAAHAAAASSATGAAFTVEGGPRTYATSGVVSVGSVLDPATRTMPVVLRVENPTGGIKVGMLADARLFLGEPESGVAVPNEAIREEDGLHVVYVEVGGESFERRVLDRGPGDGQWTVIRSGVAAGERVVTDGAYQVRLASLGEVEPADHGHPH
jgi:RND family efflux transporter MFP subunit